MLALVSFALAAGPNLLPGADHLDGGDGDVRVGAFALGAYAPGNCVAPGECGDPSVGVFAGPVVAWRVGAGDRVAVQGVALGMVGPEGPVGFAGSAVAVRAMVVDGRRVRVAPWVAGVGSGFFDVYGAVAGVALDVGGEHVRFDLSVPVVAATYDGHDVSVSVDALLASEVGFAWMLGDGHALRVGMWSLAPGVGWSWTGERWTADAALHSAGIATVGEARVGVRF